MIKKCKQSGTTVPEEKIRKWLVEISLGLTYLHSNNVIHRDIKSSNILLDAQERAKIGDFGTLRLLSHTMSKAATQGGTPEYKSPEMCRGDPYGKEVDIWALGCVVYELCMLEVKE